MAASVSPPVIAVRRAVGMAALTCWITASLRGGSSADDVTDAAARVGLKRIRLGGEYEPVMWALAQLRGSGLRSARLILPAPGDVAGLPGPAELNRRALDRGAAIIITGDGPAPDAACVLLPADGADWSPAEVALLPGTVAAWPSLRQARAEFATGVAGHAQALAELDVAADARGLRDVVLCEDGQPLPPLPPTCTDERRELLGRARLVAVLAATATADDGAAVSAAEASSRSAHLRSLATIARRAMAASVSGP